MKTEATLLNRVPEYPPTLPWEVPACQILTLAPKQTRYCVVIPVINEGQKLKGQLHTMHQHALNERFDLLIADGGSSDGSTDPDFLKSVGVRTLLIKKDAGKLSAQLRMAYAYALLQGYEGIITIDGNNKDSVVSIEQLAEALDTGHDYVQASRFIPGGQAIRTPWSRLLGIRLLHAPLISLAARHWLTDTTNGFRAYSRRYLLHPEVQPFRTVFDTYELLAYLSIRAGQLGLRVTERPAIRRYPASGPIPTKINGLEGNLTLLRILWNSVQGHYHPKSKGS